MRTLIFIFLVALFGCTKQIPMPQMPSATINNVKKVTIKPSITGVYDVKVILKWNQVPPFQLPVLYDSVKTSTWSVNNLGNPSYNQYDTMLHVTDWFATYQNDTVKFCLVENGNTWQTAYTSPPYGTCEEKLVVNGIVKMDTILSDVSPITPPVTTLIIK